MAGLLEERRHKMASKKRMPPLTMDEVLLLVDTYYCLQKVENRETKEEMIAELSKAMHSLPFYQEYKNDPSFRSIDGMKMCLANVAWSDPNANSKFGHGSIAQRKVLDYYGNKKEELHAYSLAIKKLEGIGFPIKVEFSGFIAGTLLPSYHCYLESTSKTIKVMLKEAAIQRQTRCRICGQDLSTVYGSNASELIELHIDLPLSQNTPRDDFSPSDLILICPSCHKLAHSNPQYFETDKLKSVLKVGV